MAGDRYYDGFYKYDSAVAESYEADRAIELHWQLEDKFIRRYLKGREIDHLLDLPVGTGRFFAHYQYVKNFVGVDISEHMLNEARSKERLGPEGATTTLERGDVVALSYPTGFFDVTIVCRLFHLLPPDVLPVAIKELCRVTSREVVAQSYALEMTPKSHSIASVRKELRGILAAFSKNIRFRRLQTENQSKPWSHIQSYNHLQSEIDSQFRGCGFEIKASKSLADYTGTDVRMTVYQKSN